MYSTSKAHRIYCVIYRQGTPESYRWRKGQPTNEQEAMLHAQRAKEEGLHAFVGDYNLILTNGLPTLYEGF